MHRLSNFRRISNSAFISYRACSEMCTASVKFLFCSTTSMRILRRSRISSFLFLSAALAMPWKKSGSAFFFHSLIHQGKWIPHSWVLLSESVFFFHESTIFVCLEAGIFHIFCRSLVPCIKRWYIFLRRHCHSLTFRIKYYRSIVTNVRYYL